MACKRKVCIMWNVQEGLPQVILIENSESLLFILLQHTPVTKVSARDNKVVEAMLKPPVEN